VRSRKSNDSKTMFIGVDWIYDVIIVLARLII